MTIKEMTYRIWQKLDGGYQIGDDSKYTYKELSGYVRAGAMSMLQRSYYEQRNSEDFKYGDSSISFSYSTPVLTDNTSGLKYVVKNHTSLSVAGNRFTNISSANPVNRFNTSYYPIRKEELVVMRNQPSIPCVVFFYEDNNKLYFINEDTKETNLVITAAYALPNEDDVDITLPEEFENGVYEQILRLLLPAQFPSDRSNDGVPNN